LEDSDDEIVEEENLPANSNPSNNMQNNGIHAINN